MTIYFENLIIRLHVICVLSTHVKFCTNWILFIVQSINFFSMHNLRQQKLEI